jgi:type IV secretion system protein VirB1
MLATVLLGHLISSCAPGVGPRTMSSIVAVESGGDPLAVHDNTSRRSYRPDSPDAAIRLASRLIGLGHSVDLGLAQINDANLPGLGLSVRSVFDPCINVRAGAEILSGAYRRARAKFGDGQFALRRAIGAYNTGDLARGDGYIASVVAAAGVDFGARTLAVPSAARPRRVERLEVAAPRSASGSGRKPGPRPDASPNDAPIVVPVTAVPVAVVSNGSPDP